MDINKPSTSTGIVVDSIKCLLCDKFFTSRGINIHITRSHNASQDTIAETNDPKNNNVELTNSLDLSHTQTALDQTSDDLNAHNEPCPYCGKLFQSCRGVNIHISRAHPAEYRSKLVNQNKSLRQNVDNISHTQNDSDPSPNRDDAYNKDLCQWKTKFTMDMSDDEFNVLIEEFLSFLAAAVHILPGPKHPAQKYYEARKNKCDVINQQSYKQSSNPQRATKRDREKRKGKYKYQLTQFLYYNQRRKALRQIFGNETPSCKLDSNSLHSYFSEIFSTPNTNLRQEYPNRFNEAEYVELNDCFYSVISKEEVIEATKKIAIDTASGPDHVIVRPIKHKLASEIIAIIATRMLTTGFVPTSFKKARTILIYKSGDSESPGNWRPITICSVVRRVIEKVLDKRLRQYICLNNNQRGFTSSPGAHVNTSILEAILKSAKRNKTDVCVVFLDIRKAFDNVGHAHLRNTLQSLRIPQKLSTLIMNLQEGNITQIETKNQKTNSITFQRGVLQGSPLSPCLYNIATDHILEELSEQSLASRYGFSLIKEEPKITIMGFADDTVIVGKNLQAATELTKIALHRFGEIGLNVSLSKSTALCVNKGKICETNILLEEEYKIQTQNQNDPVRYLGVNFLDELKFDPHSTIKNLQSRVEALVSSPLLQPAQKFTVLTTSISPTLVYPFQITPLPKLPQKFLTDVDKLLRSTLKEILQLPTDTPDHMIYASRKNKGLGFFCATWEARLQHINICQVLLKENNPYINGCRELDSEITSCLKHLEIEPKANLYDNRSLFLDARKVRRELRERAFTNWCELPHKGRGVILYKEYTAANKWIQNHQGLSCSEWKDTLKMTTSIAAVRSIPGRSQGDILYRRCHREYETLAHVLGVKLCVGASFLTNFKWTKTFDIDLFIDEVEKSPAIWNMSSTEYSNKLSKRRAWEDILLIFCDSRDAGKKWISIFSFLYLFKNNTIQFKCSTIYIIIFFFSSLYPHKISTQNCLITSFVGFEPIAKL